MDDELDSQDDSSDPTSGTSGLVELLTGANSTTEEARGYAEKILSRELQESSYYPEEQQIIGEYEKSAEQAKQVLRDARQRLLAKKWNPASAYFAAAAGFGAPTKTGAFGETMGHVAENMIQPLQQREQEDDQRESDRVQLETGMSAIDRQLLEARLKLAGLSRTTRGRLGVEALKTLGRPVGGSRGSQMSTYGKIARDEGLEPGSPEFNDRVHQLRSEDLQVHHVQAGMDVEDTDPKEQAAASQELGVPLAPVDPFAGMSIKNAQKVRQAEMRRAETTLTGLEAVRAPAQQALQDSKRFLALLPKIPPYERGPVKTLMGRVPALSSAGQEADKIKARVSRTMRVPGEGSTSNFDAQQFRLATFGREANDSTNRNVVTGIIAQKQRELDRYYFMNSYYDLNGHLRGANELWQSYLDANPIFDPEHPGEFLPNAKRQDYRDYFRNQMQQAPAAGHARGGRIRGYQEGGSAQPNTPSTPPIQDDEDQQSYNEMMQMLRAGVQGGTAGFGDEIMGAMAPGDLSDETVKQERAKLLDAQENQPLESGAAQAGGAILTAQMGRQVAKMLGYSERIIATLPEAQLLKLALFGATSGFLSGIGGNDNPQERAIGAGYGAVAGAGAGTLAGLSTKYGLASAEGLYDIVRGQRTTPAESRVLKAMETMTPEMLTQRVTRAQKQGVPAMAADMTPRLRGLTETALGRAGEASSRFTDDLLQRQEGSRGRVSDVVSKGLKPVEYFGELDNLKNELYTNAKPLYEQAYQQYPGIKTKALDGILGTPSGKAAVGQALRFMKERGHDIGKMDALGMVRAPSLEFLDQVKRGYDQLITKEEPNGVATPWGRELRAKRNALVKELDDAAPEYKEARAEYAGDLEILNSLKAGREDFHRMQPEEVKRAVSDMSRGEKEAFRTGVAQKLYEMIDGPSADINAARKLIGSPATRAKLEALFDRPRDFKLFDEALKKEMELFESSRKMIRSGLSGQGRDIAGEQLREFATAPRSGVFWSVMNMIRRLPTMTQKTADDVLKMLHSGSPRELTNLEKRLTEKSQRLARRKSRSGKVAGLAAVAGGALMEPSPRSEVPEEEPEEEHYGMK